MKNFFFTLIFLTIAVVSATAFTLNVTVSDSDKQPLTGATVKLENLNDTIPGFLKVADIDGIASFDGLKPDEYRVTVTMTGMDTIINYFDGKDLNDEETVNLDLTMMENSILLQEAVVTATKAAIVAKQDTLEYNAGSFRTGPNATVNDLLKKLPGVEVSSDGSITSQGKTVSKILVDGKEFFSDDPQMATQNLLSDMVDKVQVIDRKSDIARLTGIDDGEEETVINLTVKKEMQNSVFGNISGGYGSDDRYQGSFVINSFHNGNQITFLGGLNNINENGFTDRGRGRFRGFGNSGGITAAQRLGVNFNIGKEEILRFGGNILYSHSKTNVTRKSATQYLFPDSVSYQNAGSQSVDRGHNINSDFRLQWNIDEANTLDFRPRFSFNFRDTERKDSSMLALDPLMVSPVNRNLNLQNNRGTNYEISGNLIYNHNFLNHPGRSLSFNAQYSFSNNRQKGLSWNDINYYLLQDSDELFYRLIDNHTWSNSIEGRLTWTEPVGNVANGNFLTLAYRLKYQWNDADQLTYNLDPFLFNPLFNLPSPDGIFPDSDYDPQLSNRFRNKFLTQEVQIGYKKVSKTLNLEAGLIFSPSESRSDNLIDEMKNIPTRKVFNLSPFANLRYKFGERSSLRINYRARTSQPSMSQLQPVADVSDPLNITIGNPELKPTFTQSVGIFINDYRVDSQQALALMLNGSYSLNSIVSRTVSDPVTGGRTTTYGNVNGNLNLMAMAMLNRPFTNKKWRFNVRLMSRFASTPGYIDGRFNRTANFSIAPSAGLTYSIDIFQMSVNPTYSFSNVSNTLPDQRGRRLHSYGFTSDLTLTLPFGVALTTDLAFSNNTGYSTGFDNKQWLWNAQLSYSFLSDKSLTLAVKGYDILQMKKNISRTISASTIIDNEYNELTRYVMVSLTWNFNSLKKKVKSGLQFEGEGFPGPPPGENIPGNRGGAGFREGPLPGAGGPPPGMGGAPPF